MIITCTSCSTRFLVDAASIGPKGRQVRCARCQHDWFQKPPIGTPQPAARASAPAAGAAVTLDRPIPLRQGANLPVITRQGRPLAERLAWAGLIVFTAAVPLGLYGFQQRITAAWPPSARLYAALGMAAETLEMRLLDVSFAQVERDGIMVLTVKGAIVNDAGHAAPLPAVLIRLRDAKGGELRSWTHTLPQAEIGANSRVEFETSHTNPPAEASNLDVSFAPVAPDLNDGNPGPQRP